MCAIETNETHKKRETTTKEKEISCALAFLLCGNQTNKIRYKRIRRRNTKIFWHTK